MARNGRSSGDHLGTPAGLEAVFDKRLSAAGRVRVLVQLLQRWTVVDVDAMALRKLPPGRQTRPVFPEWAGKPYSTKKSPVFSRSSYRACHPFSTAGERIYHKLLVRFIESSVPPHSANIRKTARAAQREDQYCKARTAMSTLPTIIRQWNRWMHIRTPVVAIACILVTLLSLGRWCRARPPVGSASTGRNRIRSRARFITRALLRTRLTRSDLCGDSASRGRATL